MKNLITALTLTILLASCATMTPEKVMKHSINVLTISEALAGFKESLDSAEDRVLAASEMFTSEEWMKLVEIEDILRGVEKTLSHIANPRDNAKEVLVAIAYIDTQMEKMYHAYKLARSVFHSSRDRLSAEDVEFYIAADAKIEQAYVAYVELKNTETGSDATKLLTTMMEALKLVVRVVTVVAPLVLI